MTTASPFVWGQGGAQLTPEQLAKRRMIEDAALARGVDTSPVGHWSQGLARVADALGGSVRRGRLDKAEGESQKQGSEAFSRVMAAMNGGQPQSATVTAEAPDDYMHAAMMAESGGDPNAKNPNSTATGPYQFLEGTWNDIMTRHKDLGLTPDGRTDPVQARKAMQVFTDENATHLGNAGIKADRGNLYAAHFLGAGGAVPVLQAPDDAPVSSLVPSEVMQANPHLANMTAGQFKQWAASKGGGQRAPGNQVAQAGGGMPGGISPEILAAASSPHLTDTQRTIVNTMLKGAMERSQPKDLMDVGGRVFDPNTRGFVTEATPKEQPTSIREYEYAKSQGFPGTFADYQQSMKGGMSLRTNADGTVEFVQGPGASKPLTEAQSKDTVFVTRAAGSLPLIDQHGDALTNLGENVGGSMPVVGNYMKSPQYQQAEQAGKEFLQAILRKDTGAAITKEETEEYGSVYLPRPGDKPEVLAQKKAARTRALQAIELGLPPQALLKLEGAGVKLSKDQPKTEKPVTEMTDEELEALANGN